MTYFTTRTVRAILCGLLLSSVVPNIASAYAVRVSVKFILDANGNRPSSGNVNTTGEILLQVMKANAVLCSSGSDMRIVLTEIVDVAGLGGYSMWPCSAKDSLQWIAKMIPSAFRWRSNAINVYITGSSCPGVCSFSPDEIIMLGQGANSTTLIHEIGHYLGLYHTHGKSCDGNSSCGSCYFDDDGLSSTLLDAPCWSRNTISSFNYGKSYRSLVSWQRNRVDDTFENVMSYHSTRTTFTSQQIERMYVHALIYRAKVVDLTSGGPCFSIWGGGDSSSPDEIEPGIDFAVERHEVSHEIASLINPEPGDENAGPPFLPGDVDDSRSVDIRDAVAVLGFLHSGGERPACEDAADVNDNGRVDLSDPIAILSGLFLGQVLPRGLPIGFPTVDRTPDDLGCAGRERVHGHEE